MKRVHSPGPVWRSFTPVNTPALDHFNQALAISRRIGDLPGQVTRLNNVGTVYYYQGRYTDAMGAYQQAEGIVKSSPNEPWTASRAQLTTANLAILYQTVGQYERALEIYSGLLRSKQALPPQELAQLLTNIGTLRRRLGDPQKALDTYREAQSIYAKAAHRDGEIAVLNNIAIAQAMDLHDYDASVKNFTAALNLSNSSNDRPLAVHARLYRAEALYRAGRLTESTADFEDAANEAKALGEKEETWKALFGMARVASAKGNVADTRRLLVEAVAIIESMRTGLRGSSLRSEFLAEKRDVYDLLIEHSDTPQEVFRLMEQSRARDIRDRLGVPAKLDLSKFAASLKRDEAVLEYWIGPTSAAVLWISADRTGMSRRQLTAENKAELVALPTILSDSRRADWRQSASRVSKMLLPAIPVLSDAAIRNVVVVPDGPLGLIPFEALPLTDSALMTERFIVSYSPSASLTGEKRATKILWPWQTGLKALADPNPGSAEADFSVAHPWARLPEAAREVTSIAKTLGTRSVIKIGADARKSALIDPPLTPLLHIASHAYMDSREPDRSYILFAPSAPSQRFDYLYLKEAYELPLRNVDLATISACETDAGKFVPGEGVQSFTGAFIAAGAKSVVTSLWKVGDNATAELMVRFYSHLADRRPKAEALRNAKLEFIRSSTASHPAFWAAFVMTGDGQSQTPYIVKWWFLIVPAALLAIAIALLRMRARRARR